MFEIIKEAIICDQEKNTFESLKYLRKLDLASNAISYIQKGAFIGLEMLLYLDLGYNLIIQMTSETLKGL